MTGDQGKKDMLSASRMLTLKVGNLGRSSKSEIRVRQQSTNN
jgi:hypothetical protein